MKTPKRAWNLDLLKNARLEIARVRGRGARFLPRCRTLAHLPSHSRILEPRIF